MTVILFLPHTIGVGRDNSLNSALRKMVQHMIGVGAFIRKYSIDFESLRSMPAHA